jgi:hypothetical protein
MALAIRGQSCAKKKVVIDVIEACNCSVDLKNGTVKSL